MRFRRAVPPGPAISPESLHTGLALGDHAGPDRPYVFCNFVSSADGKATAGGRTAPLGGDGDRKVFHLLRTQADAILAGTRTLRIERYGRLIRSPEMAEIRAREGRPVQPLAVVVSLTGRVPFEIPLFADPESRVVLYAPPGVTVPADAAAEVMVRELPESGRTLAGVLRSLRQDYNVRSLLCEGGPILFDALLLEGVVDELFLTLAPTLVGGEELAITVGPPLDRAMTLRMIWALEYDGHLFLRYARS